jgi:hypothetical protein
MDGKLVVPLPGVAPALKAGTSARDRRLQLRGEQLRSIVLARTWSVLLPDLWALVLDFITPIGRPPARTRPA